MADDIVVRAKYCREWGNFDDLHGLLLAEVERVREELAGAQQTIAHQCEAMSWIAGHDRQGRDHAQEMLVASAERDAAESEARRLKSALDILVQRWKAQTGGLIHGECRAALDHYVRDIEAVLRGGQ